MIEEKVIKLTEGEFRLLSGLSITDLKEQLPSYFTGLIPEDAKADFYINRQIIGFMEYEYQIIAEYKRDQ